MDIGLAANHVARDIFVILVNISNDYSNKLFLNQEDRGKEDRSARTGLKQLHHLFGDGK